MAIQRTPGWASNRDRILDAARGLVVEHGWDRFSLRKLARTVGLSPPSLYEYFDGKQAILDAIADRARKRLVDELRGVEGEDRLVALALAYVHFARLHREDFLLLYGRPFEEPPGRDTPYSVWLNQVARELGPAANAPQIAYSLWACAHGLAMLQVTALASVTDDFGPSDHATVTALAASLRG